MSVVFQDSRLLPWQRVLDNVVLGLRRPRRRGRAAARRWPRSAWPAASRPGRTSCPAASSSGPRWPGRWSASPQLLLADEPFGALDALTRIRMHVLLRKLCDGHRPAVLLVTHDVDEAIVLADRVIVLDDGVRRRSDLAHRPARRRVARPTRPSPRCARRLLAALGVEDDHQVEWTTSSASSEEAS